MAADYYAFPLWDSDAGGVVDASSLPISTDLVARLQKWADRYDATLNLDDPRESGFSSPDEETAFTRDGKILAGELQVELGPEFDVRYGD